MNKIERDLVRIIGFAALSFTAIYVAWDVTVDNQRKASISKAAGFADYDQMQLAQKAGISDPAAWDLYLASRTKVSAEQASARAEAEREEALRRDKMKAAEAVARSEATRNPATAMSVKNFSWKKGGFGSVAIMDLTIANENNFAIKDVTVRCRLFASSGTELSTVVGTIYQIIQPKSTKTFADVNMGLIHSQSSRSNCGVETAKRL